MIVRPANLGDLDGYIALQGEAWPDGLEVAADHARQRFQHLDEGIFVAIDRGRIVGSVTVVRLTRYDWGCPSTWYEVTSGGGCAGHDPHGSIAYGVDLSVSRDAPPDTIDALSVACMTWVIRRGIKYFALGGRMPRYHRFADRMSPSDYLWRRTPAGRFRDPEVELYSRVPGMKVLGVIPNYFVDPESLDNGVLLRWRNPVWRWPGRWLWSRLPNAGYGLWKRHQSWRRRVTASRSSSPA